MWNFSLPFIKIIDIKQIKKRANPYACFLKFSRLLR